MEVENRKTTLSRQDINLSKIEFAILAVISLLTLWSVRPLLEEWGLILAFDLYGFSYISESFNSLAMRPLHLFPALSHWVLGQGTDFGVAIFGTLLIITRYFVARWAVRPYLTRSQTILFSTCACLMISWPGLWLGRFHPAQVSSICFFIGLGLAFRLNNRTNIIHAVSLSVAILISLMTYQAFALLFAALPLVAFFFKVDQRDIPTSKRWKSFGRILVPTAMSFIIYVFYAVLISRFVGSSYEVGLLGGGSISTLLPTIFANIELIYSTAFIETLSFLPLTIGLIWVSLMRDDFKDRGMFALWITLLAFIPLSAIIYYNPYHANDYERILVPISAGVVALMAMAMSSNRRPLSGTLITSVIAILLMVTWRNAAEVRGYWQMQSDVIDQLADRPESASTDLSLIIYDYSGELGDIYTLFGDTIGQILSVRGLSGPTVICTPDSIDRYHDEAARYPLPTTPRCDELPPELLAKSSTVKAVFVNGAIELR